MTHYNLESQPTSVQQLAAEHMLDKPYFIGQGWAKHVGSDCYGGYVTAISKTPKGKPLIGLTGAKTRYITDWTDGSQECSLDMTTAKPTEWITTYGYDDNGNPKWWYCDETGFRKPHGYTTRCRLCWNGACAYQDPNF